MPKMPLLCPHCESRDLDYPWQLDDDSLIYCQRCGTEAPYRQVLKYSIQARIERMAQPRPPRRRR